MRYFLALFFYRVLFLLLTPVLLAVLLVRSINHTKYRHRLLERLGLYSTLAIKTLKPNGIVVHAASVGEVIALKAFITQLIVKYPTLPITITTFTPTGSEQVVKLFGNTVQHCYLPFDNIVSTHLFLKRLRPKAIVFMETELWPNLIARCQADNIKLLLVNGRLSDKSMRSYQKISWLITPAIQRFGQILTQSQVNQEHYLAMGATSERCRLSGNLKFDISISNDVVKKQQELTQLLIDERDIWLVASTHPGDEALALEAFEYVKQKNSNVLLVIVPRHPERFVQVAKLAQDAGNNVITRSSKQPVTLNTDVWVIDTLGELLSVCALSDVVTMGGSFSNIGGHNPLEPALFNKPVIAGPNMSNFTEILSQLISAQGIVQIAENNDMAQALSNEVLRLLLDNVEAKFLGENAYRVVQQNQGATQCSLQALTKLIN